MRHAPIALVLLLASLAGVPATGAERADAGAAPDSIATLDGVISRLRTRTTTTMSDEALRLDTTFRDSVTAVFDSTVAADGLSPTLERSAASSSGRRYRSTGVRTGFDWSLDRSNLDYSKVDGFTAVTAGFLYVTTRGVRTRIGGRIGYAFGSERGRHDAGVQLSAHDVTIGWAHRDETHTFGWTEVHGRRFFALAGADELDYLEREGWRTYVENDAWLPAGLSARLVYRREDERARRSRDTFTIGDPSGLFETNPQASEGEVRSVSLTIARPRVVYSNLYGSLTAETAGRGLGGDLAYDRVRARLTRITRLPWADELSVALSAQATAGPTDRIPLQALADPAGRSGVRGYPHRSLVGTHALLARIEYRLARDLLARTRIPLLSRAKLQLVPFVDVGAAWTPPAPRELADTTWPERDAWKWGAGLGIRRGVGFGELLSHVRLDAALRLDRGDARPVFYFVMEGEPFD
jgi:hypothetical protein